MKIAVAGGTGLVGGFTVDAGRTGGHEVVVLSRASGVDLRQDSGVAEALEGVEVMIDTTNSPRISKKAATTFFTETTARLQRIGSAAGVRRLVVLSIVGVDRVPGYPYYEAKVQQEREARGGTVPVTIVRATQFHEFPCQILSRTRVGPLAFMFRAQVQPVAARSVGEFLISIATAATPVSLAEIAGPEKMELSEMARRLISRSGRRVAVLSASLPGKAGRAMQSGALIPSEEVTVIGPSFEGWLSSDDAELVSF